MINIFYIILFQFFLILFLLLLTFYEIRFTYLGNFVIFSQILALFLIVFNRILDISGLNIYYLLYIVIILAILPHIFKKFLKILSGRKSKFKFIAKLKRLFFILNIHLESCLFNLTGLNKGFYYLSEKLCNFLEGYFCAYVTNTKAIIFNFLLYPWIFFITILIFEMIVYQKIYFAAVLLSLNILIYRLLQLFFKIIQYTCKRDLDFIKMNRFPYFHYFFKERDYVFFFRAPVLEHLIDTNYSIDQEFLSEKWVLLISGIHFSSCYFAAYIFEKYLLFYYRNVLNWATVVIILIYILLNLDFSYWKTFLPFLFFVLFYLFSLFNYRTKYEMLTSFFHYQEYMHSFVNNHLNMLIERNFVVENIRCIPLSSRKRYLHLHKPKNFLDCFSLFETIDRTPEKLYFHQVVIIFLKKIIKLFQKYW